WQYPTLFMQIELAPCRVSQLVAALCREQQQLSQRTKRPTHRIAGEPKHFDFVISEGPFTLYLLRRHFDPGGRVFVDQAFVDSPAEHRFQICQGVIRLRWRSFCDTANQPLDIVAVEIVEGAPAEH